MEPKAQIFTNEINTIAATFFSALDDFKKYYVYYNKNPEVNEFQNYYENSKNQLQNMSRNMLAITSSIEKHIEELNSQMINVSTQLEEEKHKNSELTLLLSGLENAQNGSKILITDSKKEYNNQYFYNLQFIISIIIIAYTIFSSAYTKK
jgi:hypothetical protein